MTLIVSVWIKKKVYDSYLFRIINFLSYIIFYITTWIVMLNNQKYASLQLIMQGKLEGKRGQACTRISWLLIQLNIYELFRLAVKNVKIAMIVPNIRRLIRHLKKNNISYIWKLLKLYNVLNFTIQFVYVILINLIRIYNYIF